MIWKMKNGNCKTIVLAPYSAWLPNRPDNPKNYPYWDKVIKFLKRRNVYIIQIGAHKIKVIPNVDEYIFEPSFRQLVNLINEADLWVSVDSFLQHFVRLNNLNTVGVVVWGPSNPNIFGYKENVNVYLDEKFFRPNQFDVWFFETFDQQNWVSAEVVADKILSLLN